MVDNYKRHPLRQQAIFTPAKKISPSLLSLLALGLPNNHRLDKEACWRKKLCIYKYVVCDKAFGTQCHLTRHKRTHTGKRPYECDVRHKAFGHTNTLRSHERIHTGEKPYSCDICNKIFSDPSNFRKHKITHTGEKLKCFHSGCSKAYTSKQNLRKHMKKCLLSDVLNGL